MGVVVEDPMGVTMEVSMGAVMEDPMGVTMEVSMGVAMGTQWV